MSHSKPGLNEPFYKWLDEVRKAIRKEKELKEKLAYYNVKLIGYKGVVYDRIGSAGTAGGEKDLYFWMDRIHATEVELEVIDIKLGEKKTLDSSLSEEEKLVMDALIDGHIYSEFADNVTRSYRYQLINRLVVKWKKMKSIS